MRTVVIAGDGAGRAARQFAEAGRWPLLAEPSSGSRAGAALTSYRVVLPHFADKVQRVVSFGHPTLSRSVTRLLARPDLDVIHVGDQSTFPVPAGPNVRFVDEVDGELPDVTGWLEAWQQADKEASAAIDRLLDGSTPFDVARTVAEAVPAGGLLVVGPSSPIRDLDLVAKPYPVGGRRKVLANRGLAGIDGVLSTAIGAALARPSTRAIAYVGDLTFLHGSNGLLIGPDEPRPDLTVVVASDDGGSIFTTLEQGAADYSGAFERVWATPTGADIGAICGGLGIAYRRVAPAALSGALAETPRGIEVIEVPLDRTGRRALEQRIANVAVS